MIWGEAAVGYGYMRSHLRCAFKVRSPKIKPMIL